MFNGKRYIGQKKFDSGSRWKSYLGSGYHLIPLIKKYGKDGFIRDIVDIAYSPEELDAKEIAWIKDYEAVNNDNYYNMIEGGKVLNSLTSRKCFPCICIDNNMAFKSIAAASDWSGQTLLTIKNSFNRQHTFDKYYRERLLFRPLNNLDLYKRLCCICGKNFERANSRQIMCKRCAYKKAKLKNKIKLNYNDLPKSNLSDEWVIKEIEKKYDKDTLKRIKNKHNKKRIKNYREKKREKVRRM